MNYLRQLKILVFLTVSHGTVQAQDQYFSSVSMETRQIHKVQPGETLSSIARRHGVSMRMLSQHNEISNPDNLNAGQTLAIPGKSKGRVPAAASVAAASVAAPSRVNRAAASGSSSHTIQKGETLSKIARTHGVSVKDLQAWNGISDPSKLKIGQSLRIGGGAGGAKTPVQPAKVAATVSDPRPQQAASVAPITSGAESHILQHGETLSAISRKHGVSVAKLMELNRISDPTRLAVGQRVMLTAGSQRVSQERQAEPLQQDVRLVQEPVAPRPTTPVEAYKSLVSEAPAQPYRQHTVRPRDTLHSISKENNVSVEALRAANGLGESNFIRDGQQLKIPAQTTMASTVSDGQEFQGERVRTSYEMTKPLFEVPEVPAPKPPVERPRQASNHFGFAPTPTVEGRTELLSYTVGPSVTPSAIPGQVAEPEDINAIAESFSTTADELRRLNNLAPGEKLRIGEKISVPASGLFGQ
jgi:LysM repeat protein